MQNSVQPIQSSRAVFVKWAPWKQGEAGLRWRLRFGDYFILLHFFALPAEHFGSLTDALRSRLPKGVIASALLSITMTDQGERENAKTWFFLPFTFFCSDVSQQWRDMLPTERTSQKMMSLVWVVLICSLNSFQSTKFEIMLQIHVYLVIQLTFSSLFSS